MWEKGLPELELDYLEIERLFKQRVKKKVGDRSIWRCSGLINLVLNTG